MEEDRILSSSQPSFLSASRPPCRSTAPPPNSTPITLSPRRPSAFPSPHPLRRPTHAEARSRLPPNAGKQILPIHLMDALERAIQALEDAPVRQRRRRRARRHLRRVVQRRALVDAARKHPAAPLVGREPARRPLARQAVRRRRRRGVGARQRRAWPPRRVVRAQRGWAAHAAVWRVARAQPVEA